MTQLLLHNGQLMSDIALHLAIGIGAAKKALYNSRVMRLLVGIDLCRKPAPGEATTCNGRHLVAKT